MTPRGPIYAGPAELGHSTAAQAHAPVVLSRQEEEDRPEKRSQRWRSVEGIGMTGRAGRQGQAAVVLLGGALLVAAPRSVEGFEVNGGVNVGGILAGMKPRLAVSPHVGIWWSTESGFLFAAQETPSILPALNDYGPGLYNQIAAVVGYGWNDYKITVGPAFSIYSIPACNLITCNRVVGISAGGHAQLDAYVLGSFGLSANVNLDWIGGNSVVLPGGLAVTAAAGPIVRWGSK